tara:strand:+ start:69325 stop:69831 length:507 start_codon:yes stop_codon:yes gene_type:complete
MPLPENRKRSETIAGGTAVGQDSNTSLWIGIGALALVAIGVGYAATRGGEETAPAASAVSVEVEEATVPTETRAPEAGEIGFSLDEDPKSDSEQRREAVAAFEQGLRAGRLWSTLSVEGTTLNLVSGACEDEGMRPTISQFSASLAAAGFTAVSCHEKHGAQVFEQGL